MSNDNQILPKEPILDLGPVKFSQNIKLAVLDILEGFMKWRLNCKLGWTDIKLRYRGSILGPFWITIIMGSKIATIGFLYAYLLHINIHEYLPYVSLSVVLWTFISTLTIDSCTIFTNSEKLILSTRLPYSVYAWRSIISNFLILIHNLLVIVIVFCILKVVPYTLYLLIPSGILWTLDSLAICLLIGILGTRFKDVPPIIASIMQALFFITPIIWKINFIHFNKNYMLLDPLYPLFEIVRAPILGEYVSSSIWFAAIVYSLILWVTAIFIFSKTRFRIPYWI
ncbi:ABC transporter permease [Commensalibacter sp. M0357]|uniref:ABC transporter permease n=1 Tax=unclassified Commensalibacter TaxID=2630218 RepID=UPI0018DC053F|nr:MULTISPECIES: ABC transporter permease [unclassified Commensalibacter]MBI0074913.1 ABC transporter permease [Commensalibacter sp. M0357]MBI0084755.1 ABC transporter permease [Commensalibacter sp. M0355]